MTTKKEKIKEWEEKGVEWCAARLWEAREMNKKYEREIKILNYEKFTHIDREVEKTNTILMHTLEENGIRPIPLRIEYYENECEYITDDCPYDYIPCEECNNYKTHHYIGRVTFYSYKIDNGLLTGITSDFTEKDFYVYKVTDERTGEVFYENNEENSEDENNENEQGTDN